ncbi:hypothetical protein AAMO2058_001555100, partial [Amorphochlora amoebiformis]
KTYNVWIYIPCIHVYIHTCKYMHIWTTASLNSLDVYRYCRDPRQILRYPMSRCRDVFYPSTEKEKLALAIIIKRSATEREARRVKRRQQEELAKLKARGHPNLTEEMCW